jgi:hypothetical protein
MGSLAAGTYHGSVTFTSSAASNSPITLPVTLTVNSSTPPPPPTTGGETFSLVVVDRQAGGTDWLLLDGRGSVNSNGTLSGSGFFTRFRSMSTLVSGSTTAIVSSGTWMPMSMTSFNPISGSSTGGTMALQVQLNTHGVSTPSTGTLTITSSGSSAGVTLAISGGATFTPAGIGTESINGSSGGGGSDDSSTTGGTGTGGTDTGGTATPRRTDN